MHGIIRPVGQPFALSSCVIDAAAGVLRDSPRPLDLRNEAYNEKFDWKTLFYDVYRVGDYVVFQGPPYFNFLPLLQQCPPLDGHFKRIFGKAKHVKGFKRGEIWTHLSKDQVTLDGAIGRYELRIQPNMSHLFSGRRVLHTLSKNNRAQWIVDWIQFHVKNHGADAVLLYDNDSSEYTREELENILRQSFPDLLIHVVSWPFPYGPIGGSGTGAVDGKETPWDSDFCQIGSMQHARFRFLLKAKSVLNADIDELVVSENGGSIFEATEASRQGFVRFPGRWIAVSAPQPVDDAQRRHRDFTHFDPTDEICPPKYCLVPKGLRHRAHTWGVHDFFGAPYDGVLSSDFSFRHMVGITDSFRRLDPPPFDPEIHAEDPTLRRSYERAGLLPVA